MTNTLTVINKLPSQKPLIRVYGKAGCAGCEATILKMASLGLGSLCIDVDQDLLGKVELEQRGLQSLPVVIVGYTDGREYSWSGFQPDKLEELAKQMAA